MNPVVHFTARWAMWFVSMVWFRVRCVDRYHVPREGGVLFVANHTSHLDPPLLGAFVPRTLRFLARSTLGSKPFANRLLRMLGVIFVVRGQPTRESMQAAIDVLRAGQPLLMFPEGSRSNDGAIGPFLRGFELLARRGGVPIVPVGIRGALRSFPRGAAFPKPTKIEIHFGEPIESVAAAGGADGVRARVAALAAAELVGADSRPAEMERETIDT